MSESQTIAETPGGPANRTPIQYHLDEHGISLTYFPEGITTVHRSLLFDLGRKQTETYHSVSLSGTAAVGILPR